MNNSTVNFTTLETSTNSITQSIGPLNFFLLSIYFLFSIPTHSYVIWLIITGNGSGVASEFFILNFSVCETANCLLSLFHVMEIRFSCLEIISNFVKGISVSGRPLFQCLMCVERYLAVVHPVTFLKYKPFRYKVICSIVAWIIILGSCLCSMFILMLSNSIAQTLFFALLFILYFSVQLFCVLAVLRALKQSGPGERGRERKEENRMKRRAFYIILITTLSIAITYVPYIITGFCTILTHQLSEELYSLSYVCYALAGFVQPILYLHRVGKLCCF